MSDRSRALFEVFKLRIEHEKSLFVAHYPCFHSEIELISALSAADDFDRMYVLSFELDNKVRYFPRFQIVEGVFCPIIQQSLARLGATDLEQWDYIRWLTHSTVVELFNVQLPDGYADSVDYDEFEFQIFTLPTFANAVRLLIPLLALRTEPDVYWKAFQAWVSPDDVCLPKIEVEPIPYNPKDKK